MGEVDDDEGVANHVGPEPCAGIREDVGEGSVGEHAGQPLSREKDLISDADAVLIAEGNMGGALCECLGFTLICGRSRRGLFQLQRKTRGDRMQAKLRDIKEELRRRWHQSIPEQGRWLRQVVTGHFAYFAVPTNSRAISAFHHHVVNLWRRALQRRSQKDRTTWTRIALISGDWLPKPRTLHPWPSVRFAVTHPR